MVKKVTRETRMPTYKIWCGAKSEADCDCARLAFEPARDAIAAAQGICAPLYPQGSQGTVVVTTSVVGHEVVVEAPHGSSVDLGCSDAPSGGSAWKEAEDRDGTTKQSCHNFFFFSTSFMAHPQSICFQWRRPAKRDGQ